MLTRLYIDNFRCFEKFEWKPGRKQLILGRNGTGKSSLGDALVFLAGVIRGEQVDRCFSLSQRNRWLNQPEQVFEVDADINGERCRYRLVIEPWGNPPRAGVGSEVLWRNDSRIFEYRDGKLLDYPAISQAGIRDVPDRDRSALRGMGEEEYFDFKEWLRAISDWHINPFDMRSRAEGRDVAVRFDLANFASWYWDLQCAYSQENDAFLRDLRESLDGFDNLQFEDDGNLYAEFMRDRERIRIAFGELSEGQRCLICLYAITHFEVARGRTVIIDEPDNFISLREIQPWLMRIDDMADDHRGQVILISHHPEILNQWANPYGVQLVRDGAGPVRIERFKGDPEGSLTAAEVVAGGWDFD